MLFASIVPLACFLSCVLAPPAEDQRKWCKEHKQGQEELRANVRASHFCSLKFHFKAASLIVGLLHDSIACQFCLHTYNSQILASLTFIYFPHCFLISLMKMIRIWICGSKVSLRHSPYVVHNKRFPQRKHLCILDRAPCHELKHAGLEEVKSCELLHHTFGNSVRKSVCCYVKRKHCDRKFHH